MNNHGWGIGTMLICIAIIGICLFSCVVLIVRLEKKTDDIMSDHNTGSILKYNSLTIQNN